MAEDKEAEAAVPVQGPSTVKLMLLVGAVAIVAAGISAGAAIMLLGGGGDKPQVAEEAQQEAPAPAAPPAAVAAPAKGGSAIYVDLEPSFVVNFQDMGGRTKFLKADVNVVTRDARIEEAIAQHMPAIRNNLVLLFSRQVYEDLLSHEGKERLRQEALAEVQGVLAQETGAPGVENLLFTSFVMQ